MKQRDIQIHELNDDRKKNVTCLGVCVCVSNAYHHRHHHNSFFRKKFSSKKKVLSDRTFQCKNKKTGKNSFTNSNACCIYENHLILLMNNCCNWL